MRARFFWRRMLLLLLAGAILIAFLAVAANRRIRPTVQQYAVNRAKAMAAEVMSDAVGQVLESGEYTYAELTTITRGETDSILSVELNTAAANRLSASLTKSLSVLLCEDRHSTVQFPLFDVTGNVLLMGRGPKVSVTLRQNGAVSTKLHSEFTDAGINQTLHRIELSVTFRAVVLSAGMCEPIETESVFLISETVIVGTVPEAYAQISF